MRALAVALVALCLLAGCNATPPTSDSGPTVTPGAVPAEPQRPPGVGPEGVADAERLVAAHAAALEGQSFTVHKRHVQRFVGGGRRAGSAWTIRVDASRKRYNATYRQSGAASSLLGAREGGVTRFANGSVVAQRRFGRGVAEPKVRLNRLANGEPAPPGAVAHGRPVPDRRLAAVLATAWRATLTREGDRFQLVATRPPTSYRSPAGRLERVERWRLVIVLTDEGLVRSYRLTYAGRLASGELVTGVRTLRYTAIGSTTVERPAWFDRAR